ncbi:MAG: hypothetical protein DHS20C11_04480 [Lysobacteraceae bacterium]|nr:MAG: hypothetical protein DHS20C11_04480 [Xanthomonadaceae bacterium]
MVRSWLFWTLLPLAVPQALRVRRTAQRFPAAPGPNSGSIGDGPEKSLVAIGDSVAAGVGAGSLDRALVGETARSLAKKYDCTICWSTHAIVGADSADLLADVLPSLPTKPVDLVLISVGVNDITGLRPVGAWRDNLTEVFERLHQHSPSAVITMAGVPPLHRFPLLPQPLRWLMGLRAKLLDRAARKVANEHDYVLYVPLDVEPDPDAFADDGFHPSEASYREMGRHFADAITIQSR